MKLWLIRHGQTDWNEKQLYTGQKDVPLGEQGRAQAAELAANLGGLRVDAVYCSDLRRAQETVQAIATQLGHSPTVDPRLREASFGQWEGLTFREVSQQFPEAAQAWVEDPVTAAPTGGESLVSLRQRVVSWLESVDGRRMEAVLAVSHGGPIRVLLCELLGVPLVKHYRFKVAPGWVAMIEKFDCEGVLCHLGRLK